MNKIFKCRDCGFVDNPPEGCYNLDKCPYCRNDDWLTINKKQEMTGPKLKKQELIELIVDLEDRNDPESAHAIADGLLLEYIDDKEITDAFVNLTKWYA